MFTCEGIKSRKSCRVAALNVFSGNFTGSYASESRKEASCNQYLEAFSRRFGTLFPHRRQLFLLPKNEHGVEKFVCSTIRPTLMPYQELYAMDSLASFMCHFIQYEPLETVNEFPTVLPSPTQVQKRCPQHDSFPAPPTSRRCWPGELATASTSLCF